MAAARESDGFACSPDCDVTVLKPPALESSHMNVRRLVSFPGFLRGRSEEADKKLSDVYEGVTTTRESR